jgi:LytS/YehU family sensor histidine kinase
MIQFKITIRWISFLFPIPFGWSALYFGIKFWLEWDLQKERAEKASSLAQQAQLQMLRYQLNPHFLFNALNSIRALIEEDTRTARAMITELSEFLRYSLVSRDRKNVKLKDELEAVRYYLLIEKKRYEEKLNVVFEIDPKAEDYPVLSFLIHPLIENAIKYGMQTSSMPLQIIIKAEVLEDRLRIIVINSGVWLKSSGLKDGTTSTGTGLENVKARLQNAFPDKYMLDTFEKDGYVHVVLEIINNIQNKNEDLYYHG